MNLCVEHYVDQVRALSVGTSALQEKKEAAITELLAKGFPTRQLEAWKYTRLDAFLKIRFDIRSNKLSLNPGIAPLPQGVIMLPLQEALITIPEKVLPYLSTTHQQGFHALNTACLQSGFFIYIPEFVRLEEVIRIQHHATPNVASMIRHVVVLEKGATASIFEDYEGATDVSYFTNSITDVTLKQGALLTHYKLQREGDSAYHVSDVLVHQEANSEFFGHAFQLGGVLGRTDTTVDFHGQAASCTLNGVYMPRKHQHLDHHLLVNHLVSHCRSQQYYRGILFDASRAVFNGAVIVARDAQKTEAIQQNKNLLLSPRAEVDTKPQLEIFADDVICTHGATVGALDAEAIFYMASRGIPLQTAQQYLIEGFIEDNVARIMDKSIRALLKSVLLTRILQATGLAVS